MANCNLYSTQQGIPCMARRQKAIFIMWVNISYIVEPSLMIGGHNGGQVSGVKGLVRLSDGQVGLFSIGDIIFPPDAFEDYDWAWADEILEKSGGRK